MRLPGADKNPSEKAKARAAGCCLRQKRVQKRKPGREILLCLALGEEGPLCRCGGGSFRGCEFGWLARARSGLLEAERIRKKTPGKGDKTTKLLKKPNPPPCGCKSMIVNVCLLTVDFAKRASKRKSERGKPPLLCRGGKKKVLRRLTAKRRVKWRRRIRRAFPQSAFVLRNGTKKLRLGKPEAKWLFEKPCSISSSGPNRKPVHQSGQAYPIHRSGKIILRFSVLSSVAVPPPELVLSPSAPM